MAVVKITDKGLLEELQAKVTLRLGRKISQQEIIDICVRYASRNLDLIMKEISAKPNLTPEKAKKIISRIEKIPQKPSSSEIQFPNPEDEEIYTL